MKYTVKIVSSIKMNANYGKTDDANQKITENIQTVFVSKKCKDLQSSTELKFSALKTEIAKILPATNYVTEVEVLVDKMENLKDSTVIKESEVTVNFLTVAPDLAKVTSVEDKDQDKMISSFYNQYFDIVPEKLAKDDVTRILNSVKPEMLRDLSKVKGAAPVAPLTPEVTPTPTDPGATA